MLIFILILYQLALTIIDSIKFCLKSIWLSLISIWHVFDPPKPKSVYGETILITGTGRGLGRELAIQYARLGANIVAVDINEKLVKETVALITTEGGTVYGYKCDVSEYEDVRRLSHKIRNEVGDISVLVNNVGVMPCKNFLRYTPEEIENIFRDNVFSHYWMLKEWLPVFLQKKKGHIVSVSSIFGLIGSPNLVPFCSTKHAVSGLMEGLFEEVRYKNLYPDVKFTTVYPFAVSTDHIKRTRIRFPSLFYCLPAHKCAEKIIECMRRDVNKCIIPYRHNYLYNIFRFFPRSVQLALLDLIDSGVDEHNDSTLKNLLANFKS